CRKRLSSQSHRPMRRGPEQYSECDALGFALRARHSSTAIKRRRTEEIFFLLLAYPSLNYSFLWLLFANCFDGFLVRRILSRRLRASYRRFGSRKTIRR